MLGNHSISHNFYSDNWHGYQNKHNKHVLTLVFWLNINSFEQEFSLVYFDWVN